MSRAAPSTAQRQDVLGTTGVWDRVAAEGGTALLPRGRQLADHLGPLLGYVIAADGAVLAELPGQPSRPLDADLLNAAWGTTSSGMSGQDMPTRADLAGAAELLRARAGAEGRRRREEAAGTAAAREVGERVDVEAAEAARAARRGALQRELAQLDEPDSTDNPRRAWWRGVTTP